MFSWLKKGWESETVKVMQNNEIDHSAFISAVSVCISFLY